MYSFLLLSSLVMASCTSAQLVSIPASYAYNLPVPFQGNISSTFLNTTTTNTTVAELLQSARAVPYVAYDAEFASLVSNASEPQLLQTFTDLTAYEAGVWVADRDEVWFTSSIYDAAHRENLYVLNLTAGTVSQPTLTPPIVNPHGGCYFNGRVYLGADGNLTNPGGVYAIDPETKQVTTVVDSYFGIAFGGPNDVTWLAVNSTTAYMYFSDLNALTQLGLPQHPSQLPNGIWRYDSQQQSLQPVVSRADIPLPNGVRSTADGQTFYATDSGQLSVFGPGQGKGTASSPAIYRFDIDRDARLVNKRLFGLARTGIADGIHVDDAGRVWTAEGEGVVVRSASGKVLGLFNSEYFVARGQKVGTANFALAGDKLIVLAGSQLWLVQLAQVVITPGKMNT